VGEPEARLDAEELFRRHATFVARFLVRFGVRPPDLDDLLQDVFLVAHARGGWVEGPAKPTSYLAAIAVRVASTGRRKREAWAREAADTSAVERASAHTTAPSVRVELDATMRRLQDALEHLDADHRAAFILYELEGESCASIAAALEIPVGTVHSRLHHARRSLRQRLARAGVSQAADLLASEGWR
jgi:RNA polymerase sigma-70 factor (ECF subfamily)